MAGKKQVTSPAAAFNFSIHGLVRGRVRGPGWLVAPVASELGYFREDNHREEPPEVEISLGYLGRDSPTKAGTEVEKIGWEGRHLIARWRVTTWMENEVRRLDFRGNLASRFIVSKWVVEPAVRVVAQAKGAAMIHAAALADGREGVLVAGAGGAGKTTWTLGWLAGGHQYLSDDFSIIYNGKLKPYLTPLRLSGQSLLNFPLLSCLTVHEKTEIWIRTLVRRLALGKVKLYFKLPPQRLLTEGQIADNVLPAGAIWLTDPAAPTTPLPRLLSPEEMAAAMAAVDREEMHGFGPGWIGEEFWREHERLILAALAGKPCLAVAGRTLPPTAPSVAGLLDQLRIPS